MSTSKKDYVAIAKIIAAEHGAWTGPQAAVARDAVRAVAGGLADHFARDNPAFDRTRFLAACGIK